MDIDCRTARLSGELYEGMLVKLTCVTIVGGDSWPVTGQDADLAVIDGTGLFHVYLDSDTDIDGQTEPDAPVSITGILSQQDSTPPYTENYRLLPRSWADFSSCSHANEILVPSPQHLQLNGCYPNPFNAQTKIVFSVAHPGVVSAQIFDLMGRQMIESSVAVSSPGKHAYIWNGTNQEGNTVSTGIYFVRLSAGKTTATGKLLFLK